MSYPMSRQSIDQPRESRASIASARVAMVVLLVTSAAALVLLPGCNTVNGLGKDIEKGGQKLQEASGSPEANKQEW